MAMKLSEKGCSKLGKVFQGFPLPSHIFIRLLDCDFEADDFESGCCQNGKDHITLTIEEAKGILWDLRDLYKQTYGYEWVKNEPWFDEFKKRIEKAEGK